MNTTLIAGYTAVRGHRRRTIVVAKPHSPESWQQLQTGFASKPDLNIEVPGSLPRYTAGNSRLGRFGSLRRYAEV